MTEIQKSRVHLKLPRIDYDAAKAAAEVAGVTVPAYIATLIQSDTIERARIGAYAMHHALGLSDGTVETWTGDAESAMDSDQ